MSSNSRITHSKGPSDGTSLPLYTRLRKDTSTKADNTESTLAPTQQQTACDQLNSTVGHIPFARPGSRAGASMAPATPTGMPLASAAHLPGQAATRAQHSWKWIFLEQPHKLQNHQTVVRQFHLLVTLCSHET